MAQRFAPQLNFFASPWSPPTWMKSPPVYNWGRLIWTEENLSAYAKYFVKYVKAYAAHGIHIDQIHIQNEPVANQKFPSCMWTGGEMRDFIRDYLGPLFSREGLDTEIWLGTINAPGCDYNRLIFDKWATEDYDYFANTVLSDEDARCYIAGVSYQWGGKIAIQRTFESWWPEIRLMQSENECGFGDNTWEYAKYVWTMLKHYISNGAESYMYWNMVLEPQGRSTWGDPQNAMITIDPISREAVFNPDFYVMKHFSNPIRRGAVRLEARGTFAADSLVFRNPNGAYVVEAFNPFAHERILTLELEGERISFELPAASFNSMILQK
ncbi:MAG: glycoside hydrolase family 30 protein [Lachnospiraceae bacterium]